MFSEASVILSTLGGLPSEGDVSLLGGGGVCLLGEGLPSEF